MGSCIYFWVSCIISVGLNAYTNNLTIHSFFIKVETLNDQL